MDENLLHGFANLPILGDSECVELIVLAQKMQPNNGLIVTYEISSPNPFHTYITYQTWLQAFSYACKLVWTFDY